MPEGTLKLLIIDDNTVNGSVMFIVNLLQIQIQILTYLSIVESKEEIVFIGIKFCFLGEVCEVRRNEVGLPQSFLLQVFQTDLMFSSTIKDTLRAPMMIRIMMIAKARTNSFFIAPLNIPDAVIAVLEPLYTFEQGLGDTFLILRIS